MGTRVDSVGGLTFAFELESRVGARNINHMWSMKGRPSAQFAFENPSLGLPHGDSLTDSCRMA